MIQTDKKITGKSPLLHPIQPPPPNGLFNDYNPLPLPVKQE